MCMHREKFLSILSFFPKSYKTMRRSATNLALRRALIRWAKIFVERYGDAELVAQSGTRDFIGKMQLAANNVQNTSDIEAVEMMQFHRQAEKTATRSATGPVDAARELARRSSVSTLAEFSKLKQASSTELVSVDIPPAMISLGLGGSSGVVEGEAASVDVDSLRVEVADLRKLSQNLCDALASVEARLSATTKKAEPLHAAPRDVNSMDSDASINERIERNSCRGVATSREAGGQQGCYSTRSAPRRLAPGHNFAVPELRGAGRDDLPSVTC